MKKSNAPLGDTSTELANPLRKHIRLSLDYERITLLWEWLGLGEATIYEFLCTID